ncbi:MAG TPA: cytochrome c [Casimicrobiaceae bacterium]|nr:cytochrome c [Casimicrobiaceae bacterium]
MHWPAAGAACLAGLAAGLFALTAPAAESSLTVVAGGRTAIYTTGGLLSLPTVTAVTVPSDPAYKTGMTYRAVPITVLLSGAAADDTVRFLASERLLAIVPVATLLAQGAGAYLAIEPADAPWPPLKTGEAATAGPFHLVWLRSDKTAVAPELWPARISRIEEVQPLGKRFPMILPSPNVAANHAIRAGFAAFQKHCMSCHTLNGGGDAAIGPDLNIPYNPTEYMRPEALRRLIRDPQSLRRWPQSKMPAFDAKTLSDRELAELLAYLRHMADRKTVPPAK